MKSSYSFQRRHRVVWGLALIGTGVGVYLHQRDLFPLLSLWHHWPVLLIVGGVGQMVAFHSARDITSGLWTVLVGAWIYAGMLGLVALHWRSDWPIAVILWGICLLLTPWVARFVQSNKESQHESR